jgi:hypothetical protein
MPDPDSIESECVVQIPLIERIPRPVELAERTRQRVPSVFLGDRTFLMKFADLKIHVRLALGFGLVVLLSLASVAISLD